MSELTWIAKAPSNIALIKYMGKKNAALNIPENSSLSLTLNSLCTIVNLTVEEKGTGCLRWSSDLPRQIQGSESPLPLRVPRLGDRGIEKMIRHFERVQAAVPELFSSFGLECDSRVVKNSDFVLRTANTFPEASGIASSASSFAAMTLAMSAALAKDPAQFQKIYNRDPFFKQALARISRQGSGSSCRSFEGPWVFWEDEDAAALASPLMPKMAHFVILISQEPKKVSSSDAHLSVRTSPLWAGRPERVDRRARLVMAALSKADIATIARITWSEAWEMHSLFHTCSEPFSYWDPGTIDALHWFAPMISESSPPIVTMDAGPNIHVIVESSTQALWRDRLRERFNEDRILEDEQGRGAILGLSDGRGARVEAGVASAKVEGKSQGDGGILR